MDEYIERKALREAFENADADIAEEYEDGTCDWGFGHQNILEVINSVPAAYVAPIPDVYYSKSSLLADLDWLESVGCKSMEIQALRERLEYGAVKPACDIVRVVHRQNEKENENGQR